MMHGILWKWLFSLGFILWVTLCLTDYYRKNIEKHPQYCKVISDDMFSTKKEPPALTFWKTLSMILSVGALIYIKRSSNLIKRCSRTNFLLSCTKPKDLTKFTNATRLFNTVAVYPTTLNYCTDLKSTEILSDYYSTADAKKAIVENPKDAIISGIAGVELLQKKLDNLEKSVAYLKQKHPGPGIVSGSPEFRKFLTLCQNTPASESVTSLDLVPGAGLLTTSSSGEYQFVQDVIETPDITPSSSTFLVVNNIPKQVDIQQDSSWSTMESSTDVSNNSETKCDLSSSQPPITEILQIRKSFSKSSKNSIHSLLEHFVDDDVLQVPGSNLLPSGTTSKTSTTLVSSSSNHFTSLFDDISSSEDDVLNTLD